MLALPAAGVEFEDRCGLGGEVRVAREDHPAERSGGDLGPRPLLFVLPGIAAALPASIERTVEKFWPTQAGQQVGQVVRGAHALSAWAGFGVFCLFVAIVSSAALLACSRRDA